MKNLPSHETLCRVVGQQQGQIGALLGLVTSLLRSTPEAQRKQALQRFEREMEGLTAVILGDDGVQSEWSLEGVEIVRSTIAETVAKT